MGFFCQIEHLAVNCRCFFFKNIYIDDKKKKKKLNIFFDIVFGALHGRIAKKNDLRSSFKFCIARTLSTRDRE